jgi:hypothetical protein
MFMSNVATFENSGIVSKPVARANRSHWKSWAMAAVALGGAALWSASEGTANYCNARDQMAPGGEATPAAVCEVNRDFREWTGSVADSITPGVPHIDMFHDPVFDPQAPTWAS